MKNIKINITLMLSLLSIVLLAACSTEITSDQGAKQNNQGDTFANSSVPADSATKTLLVWRL